MEDLTKRFAALSPAKRALLERKLSRDKGERIRPPQLSKRTTGESARASFAQERLWFIQQLEPESTAYNVPRAIRLRGNLNLKILEQSLNEIINRHESLRTTFSLIDGNLRQIVAEHSSLQLAVMYLSSLSADERSIRAKELARQEAALPFDLKHGPVVRASVLRLQSEEH